jgi:hypothetical protein
MTFQEAERKYAELRRRLQARQIAPPVFDKEVDKLLVRDPSSGASWRMNRQDGAWLRWDGRAWAAALPPHKAAASAPVAASPTPSAQLNASKRAPSKPKPPQPAPRTPSSQQPVPPRQPEPARGPAQQIAPKPAPRKAAAKPPETLAELFAMMLKKMLIGMLWQIPISIVVFFVVWVFHTYVLVVVNEGFNAGSAGGWLNALCMKAGINLGGSWFGQQFMNMFSVVVDGIIAYRGKGIITGTLFWMLFMGLITGALFRMFKMGPVKYIGGIFGTPGWIAKSMKQARSTQAAMGLMALGAGAGLGISVILGHPVLLATRMLPFLLFLTALSILCARMDSFSMLVMRLGWSDLQRLANAKPKKPFNTAYAIALVLGTAAGFLVGSLLPFLFICGCTGALLLLLAALAIILIPLMGQKGGPAPAVRSLVLLALVSFGFAASTPLWADDGGWQEAGGTMSSWWHSQGAGQAIAQGVPPALGAAAGVAAGAAAAAAAAGAAGAGAGIAPPTGYSDSGAPYWGDGSVENPFTDTPPGESPLPPGWSGDGSAENPLTNEGAPPSEPEPEPVPEEPPPEEPGEGDNSEGGAESSEEGGGPSGDGGDGQESDGGADGGEDQSDGAEGDSEGGEEDTDGDEGQEGEDDGGADESDSGAEGAAGAQGAQAGAAGATDGAASGDGGSALSDWASWAKDFSTNVIGTDEGKGLIKSFLNQVGDLGAFSDESIKAFQEMVRNNTVIGLGGEVKVTNQAWQDAMRTKMFNSSWATKIVNGLDSGATIIGVISDAISNIGQGDAWYYGIGKACGSNALMSALTSKNPALAVMELTNFLAFGGSKASDIISPTKNIGGAFNMLADKLTDTANGTNIADNRIKNGDYGSTIKNANDASEVAAEWTYGDRDQVNKELGDWVSDQNNWDQAYDQSHELWKPANDAGTIKQTLCGAGELTTDAFIKGGELAGKAGKWIGSWFP